MLQSRQTFLLLTILLGMTAPTARAALRSFDVPYDEQPAVAQVTVPTESKLDPPAVPNGGTATAPTAPADSLDVLVPPPVLTRHSDWTKSPLAVVLVAETINTGLAALSYVQNGPQVVGGIDCLVAAISLLSPLEVNPRSGGHPQVIAYILAAGFAALAAGNLDAYGLHLSESEKFWMNVIGPHVTIGLAAATEWAMKRVSSGGRRATASVH